MDTLKLNLYPRLNRRSQTAIRRTLGRKGRLYVYRPRPVLLQRLADETGLSPAQVEADLHRERKLILENPGALIYQDFQKL